MVLLFNTSVVFAESYYAPINPQIINANNDVTGLTITDEKAGCFANQDKLVPGDTIQGSYKILNTSNYDSYHLYLYSESPSGSGPAAQDLIHQMKLKLILDGKGIYNGTADGSKDSSGRAILCPSGSSIPSGVYLDLGAIDRNSAHMLKAVFSVPSTLGNRYQDASGKIRWTFYAEASGSPVIPLNPSTPPTPVSSGPESHGTGSSSVSSGNSSSNGPEPESSGSASNGNGGNHSSNVSMAVPNGGSSLQSHDSGNPPSGKSSAFLDKVFKTGDDAPIAAVLAVFVAAEVAILVLLRQRRKRK